MLMGDDVLIKKSQQGDMEAFEQLVIQYEKNVYNIAYRLTGNSEDASDLAQEAFIKVYRSIKSFRGEASFTTWLYHVVANVCKDHLRKKKIKTTSLDEPLTIEGQQLEKQIKHDSLLPDELLEQRELQLYVQKQITQMPNDYRIILIMREYMELSYEEIANQLNISMGTVKSRLSRARNMLKEMVIKEREQSSHSTRQIK